jgi:uncharacterized protein YfaT (DUF1175 family)
MRRLLLAAALLVLTIPPGLEARPGLKAGTYDSFDRAAAQVRLADDGDRSAFRSWFVFLADAQFYRQTTDVTDCAGLVRHAFREALRTHSPEWLRHAALPFAPPFPDVRNAPRPQGDSWPLFRVDDRHYAEFADAATIVRLNARLVSRDPRAARPGDLLAFRQTEERAADHVMIFVGRSLFERAGDDWVVYHTGPDGLGGRSTAPGPPPPAGPGEVRKVRLADLLRHPSPRWRPLRANPRFAGVFRLAMLW